jgi:hypothetical protein
MGSSEGPSERDDRETEEGAPDERVHADDDARRAYVEGLRKRGEAAEPDENGELPPGATHEIVERPGEPPEVRRRRFSLS